MIEPYFLHQLDRFESVLERQVTDRFHGDLRSPELGEGLTFADHRKYVPGDDTRLIDWKLYARTDEFFIKQFESERNLTVHVLLDASGSMDFGDVSKFEYGAKIGLGFCYLTAKENNDFRFSVVRSRPERIDTAASTSGEVLRLLDVLNDTTPGGEIDFARALPEYAGTIQSKSLIVVISDFLAEPDVVAEGFDSLTENDISMVHVVAPEEVDPPVRGDTIFEGMELNHRLRTYFGGRTEQKYRRKFESHREQIEAVANQTLTRYVSVNTGDEFFDSFAAAWLG